MTQARKRKIETKSNDVLFQYYCGNCDEWKFPRNPEKPNFPKNCKHCNTVLRYKNENKY